MVQPSRGNRKHACVGRVRAHQRHFQEFNDNGRTCPIGAVLNYGQHIRFQMRHQMFEGCTWPGLRIVARRVLNPFIRGIMREGGTAMHPGFVNNAFLPFDFARIV